MAKEQQGGAPETTTPGKPAVATKRKKEFKKKRERRVIPHGVVHIAASFNNTQITITDTDGVTSVAPSSPDTYTIVVTNTGPSTASSNRCQTRSTRRRSRSSCRRAGPSGRTGCRRAASASRD